jgi:hypothetical protein
MTATQQTLASPAGDADKDMMASPAAKVRRGRRRAMALIGLFLLIGFAYSLVVPPFETPDEPFHYGFARHIAQGNGLPVQSADATGPWEQEGSQAPLYYLLTGWLTRGIDQNDLEAIAVRNPRANIGDPLNPGNKNFMLYSGSQPPMSGSNLALHIGRWLSLLMAATTLWFIYLTAEFLCGVIPGTITGIRSAPIRVNPRPYPDLPLLAMALVAAIPQFLFIGASFSNDNVIVVTSAATIYWLARLLSQTGRSPRPWEWVVLGLLLGLAALSKLQGLGLLPVSGLVVLFLAWQRRDWKLPLWAALWAGVPALLLAGWWYWRNIALYGDWSGLGHLMAINGRRGDDLTLADFWPEFRGLRYSFWGLFGWFNILLPAWFYTLADLLTLAGLAGLAGAIAAMVRGTPRPRLQDPALRVSGLLLTWAGVTIALLIYWITQATGSQGRLVFPGIIAFGILLAMGLDFWLRLLPGAARRVGWATLFAVLLGMSAYALAVVLPASYRTPAPVTAVPAGAEPSGLLFGDVEPIRLLAVETPAARFRPGERVPITLYLQADQALTYDYQLFIQLLDENGVEVANLTSHPGWGRNPTTLWQPGAIYADAYGVLVDRPIDPSAPLRARVYTGFIDPASEEAENLPLPARVAGGGEVTPFVGAVELVAHTTPDAEALGMTPAGSTFGGVIRLVGSGTPAAISLAAQETLTATLLWEALGQPATEYVTYIHLRDAGGRQVAGFDQAPAGSRLPTQWWRSGDQIVSTLPLSLPADLAPGEYDLWVGLYESASGGALRLPVTDSAGLPAGDGEVKIGTVAINP